MIGCRRELGSIMLNVYLKGVALGAPEEKSALLRRVLLFTQRAVVLLQFSSVVVNS
jgi:hypothetical protein